MNDRMFRLIERLQKLDMHLRIAEGRPQVDLLQVHTLRRRKLRLRDRLVRFGSIPRALPLGL